MKQLIILSLFVIKTLSGFAQTVPQNWIASYRTKVGVTHAIVLADGRVMTWLPGGEMSRIEGLPDAMQVSGGEEHLLVLDKTGAVWTIGNNKYFQLGDPKLSDRGVRQSDQPVKVTGLQDVISISAFSNSNYALLSDGTVWTWGNGNEGMSGDGGKITSGGSTASVAGKKSPVKVSGLDHVIAIAGPMALKDDGSVWTWGEGWLGRLGRGEVQSTSVPGRVPGIHDALAISGNQGGGFALLKDGTVMAWGNNYKGQLGNGVPSSKISQGSKSLVPVKVTRLTDVKAIDAYASILALRKNGTVMGWGWGELSALGPLGGDVTSTPVHVHNLSGVKAIKAGNGWGFAILNDGSLVGWGAYMVATGAYKNSKTVIKIGNLEKSALLYK